MSIFEFVTVAISIIIGLGVAELLSAGLDLYRFRRVVRIHWIPLAWAVVIWFLQITFWWNLFELNQRTRIWSYADFLLTIGIALTLFAAGSLILPKRWPPEGLDLMDHFQSEGKAGVAAFAAFHVVAVPFNAQLFNVRVVSVVTLLIAIMLVLQIAVVTSRTTRSAAVLTAVFLIVQVVVLIRAVAPGF